MHFITLKNVFKTWKYIKQKIQVAKNEQNKESKWTTDFQNLWSM